MPRLGDFCIAQKDKRDRFEILAFHDASVRTLAELDEKLESAAPRLGKDKRLPFPILLDSTGETLRRYGVTSFPTCILIDPEGRIVGRADEKILEQKIR